MPEFLSRFGKARRGMARPGGAWQGKDIHSQGLARLGGVWLGKAGRGKEFIVTKDMED